MAEHLAPALKPGVDVVALERDKIRAAIRTDVILSAEIIVITLGTVSGESFAKRLGVLTLVAVVMTVGVYGFVALVVKLDDAGISLSRASTSVARGAGKALLKLAPLLMKGLSLAGTAAMFLVGGGILVHGLPPLHHLAESFAHAMPFLPWLAPLLIDALTGIVAGSVILLAVTAVKRLLRRS